MYVACEKDSDKGKQKIYKNCPPLKVFFSPGTNSRYKKQAVLQTDNYHVFFLLTQLIGVQWGYWTHLTEFCVQCRDLATRWLGFVPASRNTSTSSLLSDQAIAALQVLRAKSDKSVIFSRKHHATRSRWNKKHTSPCCTPCGLMYGV